MGQYNLNRIFKPRHVAVVGASEKAGTIGIALMRNLIDSGLSGMLLPVNAKYKSIHGHESFGSISALCDAANFYNDLLMSNKDRFKQIWDYLARHTAMISTKAGCYIRKYRTIILVEGIFDYFAFYNLLQDQDKPVDDVRTYRYKS